ncbi:L-rhamnose/proton symporter RhaT, partial [Escherichia sp. R-CC3]
SLKADFSLAKPLITHNVLLSALGGLMWYLQFFFYAWGHARIPAQYDYISWMLLLGILFAQIWPTIQNGIDALAHGIVNLGAIG